MSKNLSDIFPPTEIGGGGGGIEEAPLTGKMYARQSGAWSEFATANLDDGNQDGEILTWDTATANWTHDDTMIVKGGNVGIGTDSARSKLDVVSGSGEAALLVDSRATDNDVSRISLLTKVSGSNSGGVIQHSGGSLSLSAATNLATKHLTIDSTGNVGIGTDSPTGQLDVRATSTGMVASFRGEALQTVICT